MLVDDCGPGGVGWGAGVRGGWSTPGGCRNSAMSFSGSVPSLHPAGSMRSLRSHHSMQVNIYTNIFYLTPLPMGSWIKDMLKKTFSKGDCAVLCHRFSIRIQLRDRIRTIFESILSPKFWSNCLMFSRFLPARIKGSSGHSETLHILSSRALGNADQLCSTPGTILHTEPLPSWRTSEWRWSWSVHSTSWQFLSRR